MIAETDNLVLREFQSGDAENIYLLNLDQEVIKYTGDEPFNSIQEAERFLASYDQYIKYGIGRWSVIRKSDEAFLGWCGLRYKEQSEEVDLGFRFHKKYWNQGYATEAAKACIYYGMEKKSIQLIVGRVMKVNTASIAVLKKCGMKYLKDISFSGFEGEQYFIEK
jgi:ribosomal-protein-alanine N-acetyltransferase